MNRRELRRLMLIGGAAILLTALITVGIFYALARVASSDSLSAPYVVSATDSPAPQGSASVGASAPDFTLPLASGGRMLSLSEYRGQPLVLTFGASWCAGCREEAPRLASFGRSHPDASIVMVDNAEEAAAILSFAHEFGMTYPIVLDQDGSVGAAYRVRAIPMTFFIDGKGVIQGTMLTYDDAQFTQLIKKIGMLE